MDHLLQTQGDKIYRMKGVIAIADEGARWDSDFQAALLCKCCAIASRTLGYTVQRSDTQQKSTKLGLNEILSARPFEENILIVSLKRTCFSSRCA